VARADSVRGVHVVVNHLRLRDPLPQAIADGLQDMVQRVVDAGGIAASVAMVSEQHLILILTFTSAEDADRIAREVGGPWMRENIIPLLEGCTERSVAKVIAAAPA
jgi:hypothetical protein